MKQNEPAFGQAIAEIWAHVLGTAIAKDASFFELGGTSLQAAQVIARLNHRFAVQLPLRSIFDAPTIEGLAAMLADERVRAPNDVSGHVRALPRSAHRGAPPLSFSQERMWFMHALAAGTAAYHVPLALLLRGKLDAAALRCALMRAAERHESLRTTFIGYSTGVSPLVRSNLRPSFVEVTLARGDGRADEQAVADYLSEFTNGTFDLERGPLLRAALIRIAVDEAILLIVAQHIVVDQWSLDVLLRELASHYNATVAHAPGELPAPSFGEYARWHRRWFDEHRRRADLEYWTGALAGLEPTTLNADYPRPPSQTFRGAKLRLPIEPEFFAALTALGAKHRSTLALVLMTALKVLLHRHSGRSDIAIGVPVANRQHLAAESLIGTLVNTLVLRTDLSGNPDFATALARVRDVALQAFEHQDTPFDSIVNALQLPRDASRSSLFSVLFNMLNTPLGNVSFEELTWSRVDFDKQAAQFDLTVTVDVALDRSICFEYATDLFAPATIERLAEHFMQLLHGALEPGKRIGTMPLMSSTERALLDAWSRGPDAPLGDATVADLLHRACERAPAAIALEIAGQRFTYRELDEASTRIAIALQAYGLRPGDRVGLCLPRSAQLIIAQWATLKAGVAYVPLDPSYPRERLALMMSDAGIAALISDPMSLSNVEPPRGCRLIDVDSELAKAHASCGLTTHSRPTDPAYVIYTSGSTGQPKGVVVSHRAVVNFLSSMAREPGLTADDRVLAVTTLSFDIAVLELLLPWSVGASVVLTTQEQVSDADALSKLIEQHDITLLQATPSTWRMLVDAGWSGRASMRALVGGEPLSRELAEQLAGRCAEVWNMYGPTETTVWSTCWRVSDPTLTAIALGRPIANTQIHVLDERMQRCPIGVPGEIYIGGAGLAEGYWNQPQLTAERFLTLALGEREGAQRLYRTGDRGRWRRDGLLEHLGRLDTQVKVRGHRIELGEIEAHLTQHPRIKQSLVTAREVASGDVRLVSYVVADHPAPDAAELRTFLRDKLPAFMLPQWFIPLDRLPTLPNGKLDRHRLPIPQPDAVLPEGTRPSSETEDALCRIWCEILQLNSVGVQDDFFDLGGHSLLSVRLVSRIRVELRRACTLPMVFRNPTVASLAAALEAASELDSTSLIPLQPLGDEPAVFCLCGIQIYQPLADQLAPDVPVYGVFVPMEMEYIAPADANEQAIPTVELLAAAYLKAIRASQPHGPYRLLGFSFGGVLAYEIAQQLHRAGERVDFLAILDSDVPDRRREVRAGNVEQRLRLLKRQLAGRVRSRLHRFRHGARPDQEIAEARDEKYLAAIRAYVARGYAGPAVYIRAADEPEDESEYGWHALISDLRTYRVPGDHLGILSAPNVEVLAQYLRSHLTPVRGDEGSHSPVDVPLVTATVRRSE